MNPTIVFDNIHRAFGARHVLRGLSFEVAPGEVYALLGRNGEGKTTAIRVLLGLLDPMAGRSSVLGVDSRDIDGALRERIGFVAEGHQLEGLRTVAGTLDFERVTRARFDEAWVRGELRRLDLRLGSKVSELSRGQRAQLALVLALAGRPEVLVFDDPAMGLDVVMRRELLDVLIDLLAREGVSVLLTTHALADVERLADRIGILHAGRLVVDATREDLRERVEQRFLASKASEAPSGGAVVASRRVLGGFELTLLDAGERDLQRLGAGLSPEARVPTLEELFVALTARAAPGDAQGVEQQEVRA